jgi:four helix bundle protein
MNTFRDLLVWQEAHKLTLLVYRTTEAFPKSEQFGLTSQMRRAAVSVPANIVEGFKRTSGTEKVRFYNIAEASLEEFKYDLILSKDLSFASDQTLFEQADTVGRLLHRFIQSTRQNVRASG